jgi:hypothetical protein
MIGVVRSKLLRKAAQLKNPSVRGTPDEEDAKTLAAIQEKVGVRYIHANISYMHQSISTHKLWRQSTIMMRDLRVEAG